MEFVAHRFGNDVEKLTAAEDLEPVVELDVHLGRGGAIEVRHGKRLWPTSRLWEKWYLLPEDTPVPSLGSIVDRARPDTHLWLDLKGPDPRLAKLVAARVGDRRPLTVSTKAWWVLKTFADSTGVRRIRSAGNRLELALLLWLPTRVKLDGAVVHRRLLTDSVIRRLLSRGMLFTWAVEDAETIARFRQLGVTGVIVDHLDLIPQR